MQHKFRTSEPLQNLCQGYLVRFRGGPDAQSSSMWSSKGRQWGRQNVVNGVVNVNVEFRIIYQKTGKLGTSITVLECVPLN